MEEKQYVCPACKEKQTIVRQWQTVSVAHDFNLQDNKFEPNIARSEGGDHESFACPCGEDLPEETIKELNLWERI